MATEGLITAGSGRLFVRDLGSGHPIVVVHGGPDFDHTYLLPELDRLADGYRLIYYDQRGRGRSFNGEGPDDITIEGEIEDIDRVRRWAGEEKVAVLGHSWGTVLAMEYATRLPERVSHLILMAPAPASHEDSVALRAGLAARRTPDEAQRMREMRADPKWASGDLEHDMAYYRIHFRPALHRPEHLELVPARLRTWFTNESTLAARAIEDHLYELTWEREDYDLIPALRQLTIPTLVITGTSDFVAPEIARHIAEAIPHARFELLADCGHFPSLEQPDALRAHIDALMRPS